MIDVPGYSIEKILGRNSVATVFLATQQSLGRSVALRVVNTSQISTPDFQETFINNGRIAANLNHSNILTIYDLGISGENCYLAVELIAHGSLKYRITQGMTEKESLTVLKQMAQALAYAHDKWSVHGQIKPNKILFRDDGTAVLSGFGTLPKSESPHYASPEQAEGLAEIDGRSDLYSLGIVFYEMLVGQVPYNAGSSVGISLQHLQSPLPELPTRFKHFQPLLNGLLAKKKTDRLATAQDLVEQIDRFKNELSDFVKIVLPEPVEQPVAEPKSEPESKPKSKPKTKFEPEQKPRVAEEQNKSGKGVKYAVLGGVLVLVSVIGSMSLGDKESHSVAQIKKSVTIETLEKQTAKIQKQQQAAAQQKAERLAAEKKAAAETARLEEQKHQAEIARQKQLEEQRQAALKAERLKAEKKAAAEAARLEEQKRQAEIVHQQQLEEQRQAALEAERLKAEKKAAAEAARLEEQKRQTENAQQEMSKEEKVKTIAADLGILYFSDSASDLNWFIPIENRHDDYSYAKSFCRTLGKKLHKKLKLPSLYQFEKLLSNHEKSALYIYFQPDRYVISDQRPSIALTFYDISMGSEAMGYTAAVACVSD